MFLYYLERMQRDFEFSLIEPMVTPQANIARSDKLIKTGSNVFKVAREHDDSVVKEVCCVVTCFFEWARFPPGSFVVHSAYLGR